MKYTKPPIIVTDQIDRLKQRGLAYSDTINAAKHPYLPPKDEFIFDFLTISEEYSEGELMQALIGLRSRTPICYNLNRR
jgi:hypothetical protein